MSYDFDNTVREWSYTMQKLNQQDLDRNFSLATTRSAGGAFGPNGRIPRLSSL